MKYLRNGWYCAGFSQDLAVGKIRAITILNEPLAIFRGSEGIVALQDRCPHRFAPLSRGRLFEGGIACGYHGLQFSSSGKCVHNPHGPVPPLAAVRAYPAFEKYSALWVWMGDTDQADITQLPSFELTEERPGWSQVRGYLHVDANYQLITDNLLDLSHVPFLHSFLASSDAPPEGFEAHINTSQKGKTVFATNEYRHMPTSDFYKMLWEHTEAPASCALRVNMRWDAPSLMYLDTGATLVDGANDEGPSFPQGHWLTPETDRTTHYFWAAARDRFVGDDSMSVKLAAALDNAFRLEDEPMIEAVQAQMGGDDLFSLRPLLLSTDKAAVRARRVIDELIAASDHDKRSPLTSGHGNE